MVTDHLSYLLEGDGPLVFNVYDNLQEVVLATTDVRFSNVNGVAKKIAPDDPATQGELISAAKDCIRPGLTYFRRRFSQQDGDLLYLTQVNRALRLGSPMFVHDTNPTMEAVEAVRSLPVLSSDAIIVSLKPSCQCSKVHALICLATLTSLERGEDKTTYPTGRRRF